MKKINTNRLVQNTSRIIFFAAFHFVISVFIIPVIENVDMQQMLFVAKSFLYFANLMWLLNEKVENRTYSLLDIFTINGKVFGISLHNPKS